MKHTYLIFFIFFIFNFSYASSNIVYLDVQFVIDNSEIGKIYKEELKKKSEKQRLSLIVQEKNIKKKDEIIKNQGNILKEDEMKKKISELNDLLKKYQKQRNKYNDFLIVEKKKYTAEILKILNPIITDYVEQNKISIIIEKKNVLIGVKNLDITKNILKLIDDNTKQNKLTN
jgi:outer membrane protein